MENEPLKLESANSISKTVPDTNCNNSIYNSAFDSEQKINNNDNKSKQNANSYTNTKGAQEEKEDARIRFDAQLREKMLQFWHAVQGHDVEIRLYDGVIVRGLLTGTDSKQILLHMTNLQTPMFHYPRALLRMTDVVSIKVIR